MLQIIKWPIIQMFKTADASTVAQTQCMIERGDLIDNTTIAERYLLYLKQQSKLKKITSKLVIIPALQKIMHKLRSIWNCLIPICIRSCINQSEKFIKKASKFKEHFEDLISTGNIEEYLKGEENKEGNKEGNKRAIIILYCDEVIEKTCVLLGQKRGELRKYEIFMLEIEMGGCERKGKGRSEGELNMRIQENVKQKLNGNVWGGLFPMIVPIWKGLFSEIIMLNAFQFVNCQFQEIASLFEERQKFQAGIKEYVQNRVVQSVRKDIIIKGIVSKQAIMSNKQVKARREEEEKEEKVETEEESKRQIYVDLNSHHKIRFDNQDDI